MGDTAFQRARRPEQKAERREAILTAARTLAENGRVRSVTLSAIARATGLANSNVLRYFETREDILLHIAAEEFQAWSTAVQEWLAGQRGVDAIVNAVAGTLIERPLFCDLLGHVPADLEHNVSPAAVTAYKLVALAQVDAIAGAIQNALPDLGESGAFSVVAGACSIASSLWQSANPPPDIAEVYAKDSRLANACVDFPTIVPQLITALVHGLVSEPS